MGEEELRESNERLLRSNRILLKRIKQLKSDNDVLNGEMNEIIKERTKLYDDAEILIMEVVKLRNRLFIARVLFGTILVICLLFIRKYYM